MEVQLLACMDLQALWRLLWQLKLSYRGIDLHTFLLLTLISLRTGWPQYIYDNNDELKGAAPILQKSCEALVTAL